MSARRDETPEVVPGESEKSDKPFIQLDGNKKDAASAASAERSRVVAGVLAAACIALIVVSLGFVHTTSGTAWSLSWISESIGLSSRSAASSRTGKNADGPGASNSDASEDSAGDAKGDKGKEADKESKGSKDSKDDKKSTDDKKTESDDSNADADGASAQNGEGSAAAAGGSSASGGSSSANNSNGAGASNGDASSNSSGGQKDDGLISVTVSVTSSAVGNPVSAGGTYRFQQGATAYDALCALGLSVNAHGSQYGTYVAAIGGLAEKEHGGSSGWMYSVNGSTPMTACSNYVLSSGDNVVWYYVTG